MQGTTAQLLEKKSAFLEGQSIVHTVPANRRSSSLFTARAEGVGAPGFPKDLAVCPGSNRATCNENDIHRVCVQLLQGTGPIVWGLDTSTPEGKLLDYWTITGKESFRSEWWKQMSDRNGDSRCIGMDSTSMLIDKVGCDKVNIRCDATDLAFVELTVQPRTPGMTTLEPIKQCIKQKCAKPALAEADVQKGSTVIRLMGIMTAVCLSAFAAGARRRRAPLVQVESLLG